MNNNNNNKQICWDCGQLTVIKRTSNKPTSAGRVFLKCEPCDNFKWEDEAGPSAPPKRKGSATAYREGTFPVAKKQATATNNIRSSNPEGGGEGSSISQLANAVLALAEETKNAVNLMQNHYTMNLENWHKITTQINRLESRLDSLDECISKEGPSVGQ